MASSSTHTQNLQWIGMVVGGIVCNIFYFIEYIHISQPLPQKPQLAHRSKLKKTFKVLQPTNQHSNGCFLFPVVSSLNFIIIIQKKSFLRFHLYCHNYYYHHHRHQRTIAQCTTIVFYITGRERGCLLL